MTDNPLKILLVHNFYSSAVPSGENQVFEAEKRLLLQYGHEVQEFIRRSDEIRGDRILGTLRGAVATPYNPFMAASIKKKVKDFKPDIVHVHNTFPLISPAIFHSIGHSAARVLTLHNYRLICPSAIPMRDGKICTDCFGSHWPLPSVQHGCYRNSRIATLPLAASVALHWALGTWKHQVDAFISLSEFQPTRFANVPTSASPVFNGFPPPPVCAPPMPNVTRRCVSADHSV